MPLVPVKYPHAIDVAISQLGVYEATGSNDGIPATRYMRGDKLAWCAGFVLYCNEEATDEIDITPSDWTYFQLRRVSTMVKHFQDNGAFLKPNFEPKRNDVIFFGNTASDVGVQGNHVGLVEKVEGEWVHTIEGNTSNKVARRKYKLTDKTILGYGRIDLMPVGAEVPRPKK